MQLRGLRSKFRLLYGAGCTKFHKRKWGNFTGWECCHWSTHQSAGHLVWESVLLLIVLRALH